MTALNHYVRADDRLWVEPVDPGFRRLAFVDFETDGILRQGGNPRYDVVDRPRRRSAVLFTGWDPHERRLDILLDRWTTNESVLDEVNIITSWKGLPAAKLPPPRLRIAWGQWQDQLWRVADLRWQSMLTRSDGLPVQAEVTIDLIEVLDATVELSPAEQAEEAATTEASTGDGAAPTTGDGRTYTVRPGDTLSAIAQRELGDWERWVEIADLNGIPRSTALIVPGQELRLP